jgi:hypothetical protein
MHQQPFIAGYSILHCLILSSHLKIQLFIIRHLYHGYHGII